MERKSWNFGIITKNLNMHKLIVSLKLWSKRIDFFSKNNFHSHKTRWCPFSLTKCITKLSSSVRIPHSFLVVHRFSLLHKMQCEKWLTWLHFIIKHKHACVPNKSPLHSPIAHCTLPSVSIVFFFHFDIVCADCFHPHLIRFSDFAFKLGWM